MILKYNRITVGSSAKNSSKILFIFVLLKKKHSTQAKIYMLFKVFISLWFGSTIEKNNLNFSLKNFSKNKSLCYFDITIVLTNFKVIISINENNSC